MNGPVLPLIVVCALLAAASAFADDQANPSIADRAAADFRQALPAGYDVTIADPLTLKIGLHGAVPNQVNLDRINAVCTAEPNQCDVALSDFVGKIAQLVKDEAAPPAREQLRAVVRPTDYRDEMKRELGGSEPVTAPLDGGLIVMCYFDMPTAMRVATDADIKSLGLTSDDAIALCKRNVEAALSPLLTQIKELPDRAFGTLSGDPYQSSRIIFHDDWAPVAAKMGGHLIVAVPSADLVIYGREQDAAAVGALAALAKNVFQKSQRPISTDVFRWTPTGWEVAES